ncbi:ALA3 [Symbiodinium natans]|uniref:Phospholipid-transporting ATPase n=1 Tax=Symbiodinium natans TaxID=878477 RepID=A0A812NPY4_9DINO|nr:ALA3 [Symbiodinium natans]
MSKTGDLEPGHRSFEYPGAKVYPANLRNGEPNRVSTTRFTALTWIPKSLFLQFQRAANLYFLFIAIIVCMPFSPKRWQSKVIPYALVLTWTALKDLFEDSRRRRDDQTENCRKCWVYDFQQGSFIQIQWSMVKPGDFVCTLCDEPFPADLLVVGAAGHQGAFISTVNLDGETNLKLRSPPKVFESVVSPQSESDSVSRPPPPAADIVSLVSGGLMVQFASPCADLSDMHAAIELGSERCAANCENFVPRGCVLRNTPWMIAIVAYAGRDTKACLNSAEVAGKVSSLQGSLNFCVYGLLAALFATCIYMATLAKVAEPATDWAVRFLSYTITLYHVVPISLYVSFEILKLALGGFIDFDAQMIDESTGQGAKARTADLVEEMGQVDFIFSDKTGTLTANEMRFAECAVDSLVFSTFLQDPRGGPVGGVQEAQQILGDPTHHMHKAVLWFFTCLSVCHTVQADEKDGCVQYSGPSPDEVALVKGACQAGIAFKMRKTDLERKLVEVVVSGPSDAPDRVFSIRNIIEFTADRKRMSVVCESDGNFYCITKGADVAMSPLLLAPLGQKEEEQLCLFSQKGLRTLVVASAQLDSSTFSAWESSWLAAAMSMDQRTERMAECAAAVERNLELVGITAVEDRLQAGVPETVAKVKSAGIRLWVLTGDKTETAVDIAYSCNLFAQKAALAFVTGAVDSSDANASLQNARKLLEGTADGGIVLDGQSLNFILEDPVAADLLLDLGLRSRSCVCSRLSPAQKRKLVELVRLRSPKKAITLAIGDGANDVPMLLGAHVGIGIRGKEGSQAVQASDIAISQFRHLLPLLLCHGRRAYRRIATFLCYYLYKNVALAWGDVIWAHQGGFSGDVAYPEWLSTSFNAVFTSWPVLVVLAFDQDIPDALANSNPQIYQEGVQGDWFNRRLFGLWMLAAAWHGSLAWIVPNLSFGSSTYDSVAFWRASTTSFTIVIIAISLKLFLHSFSRSRPTCWAPILGSILVYVLVLFLLGYVSFGQRMQPNLSDGGDPPVPGWIFSNALPLLQTLLVPGVAILPDIACLIYARRLSPSPLFKVGCKVESDVELLT